MREEKEGKEVSYLIRKVLGETSLSSAEIVKMKPKIAKARYGSLKKNVARLRALIDHGDRAGIMALHKAIRKNLSEIESATNPIIKVS